jgi:IS30 family transposase
MTGYTQLTQLERYQIQVLSGLDFCITDIADELHRHKSTISRELRRNKSPVGYCANVAHQLALDRSRDKSPPRITPLARALARHKLRQDWSP